MPAVPKFNCAGLLLASAINSLRFFTGSEGCIDNTFAPFTHNTTGIRSRTRSNGFLASTATLIALAAPPSNML